MLKIKKDDMVLVTNGKDSGKRGKVLSVDKEKHSVIVEGVNIVTKHQKPNAANPQGGIVHKEAALDISNVMLIADGNPTRVGFKLDEDGKKVRFAKKTGKIID